MKSSGKQRLQSVSEKLGAQTGKSAGHDTAQQKDGKINQQRRRSGHGDGDSHLPDIVGDTADHAGNPELIFFKDAKNECHAQEAEQTSGEGVEHRHALSGDEIAENDANQDDGKRFLPAEDGKGKNGDDVGKSELQTGDGKRQRDLCFQNEDRQRDGGQERA